MDNLILKYSTNTLGSSITANIASFTVPAYNQDSLVNWIKGVLIFYTAYPLLIPYLRMSNNLISEKEKKIKEGMKMMGLTTTAFYLSWIIFYLIVYAVISVLYVAILNGLVFKFSNFGLILVWYYLFCCSLISLSMFVSVFFSKAKTGLIAALVFFLALQFVTFALGDTTTFNINRAASLSPLVAVALAGGNLLSLEVKYINFNIP